MQYKLILSQPILAAPSEEVKKKSKLRQGKVETSPVAWAATQRSLFRDCE
jgi:hypothetical protein